MIDPVSIPEAAKALGLNPARVRAMAAHGQLPATKIGNRWLLERAAVEQRRRKRVSAGRPFEPRNAWALLLLASGYQLDDELSPNALSRLRRALNLEGLEQLAPRLSRRANLHHFNAHPGEVSHLFDNPHLVRSGISAAGSYKLGVVSGKEADGYIRQGKLKSFAAKHVLSEAGPEGNVRLRVVDEEIWPWLAPDPVAPLAAVALDLAEDPDPRSARAGRQALAELDRRRPWRESQQRLR